MKIFAGILLISIFQSTNSQYLNFSLKTVLNEIYDTVKGAKFKLNQTVECQTAFVRNSRNPSRAIVSLKNYHVYHFKDSCYFVSKFELKHQQSMRECQNINSTDLFYINNEHEIDHLWQIEKEISDLLNQKFNKKDHDGTPDERQYHIGLKFNLDKKSWFWSNGVEFKETQFKKIKNSSFKIEPGFSAFLLFVTGKETELLASQRSSSRKNFICRLNHCYNNTKCGHHGSCRNDLFKQGYKCSCDLFSDGKHCEFWSIQSIQVLICVSIATCLFILKLIVKLNSKKKFSLYNTNCKFTIFNLDTCQKKNFFSHYFLQNIFLLVIFLGSSMFSVYLKFTENKPIFDKTCFYVNFFDQRKILLPILQTFFLFLSKKESILCIPLNPFSKQSRFITSLIFLSHFNQIINSFNFSIIQIKFNFESLDIIKGTEKFFEEKFLMKFIFKILDILLIGFDFYPILVCLELKLKFYSINFVCFVYLVFKFNQNFLKEIVCNRKANFESDVWINQLLNFLITIIFMHDIFGQKTKFKNFYSTEFLYTRKILKNKKKSFTHPFSNIYQYNEFYKYSKQFVLTTCITTFLITYSTYKFWTNSQCLISSFLKYANIGFLNALLLLNETREENTINANFKFFNFIENLSKIFHQIILISITICYSISLFQIIFQIRAYKYQVLQAYQGVYERIPAPSTLTNSKIISASIHFSGNQIAYCIWGYTNLFFLTLIIVIFIKFFISFNILLIIIGKLVLPCIVFYVLKKYTIRSMASLILTKQKKNLNLKNKKIYFLTNYISFFLNCFFTWFMCFMRMIMSFFIGTIFVSRLDQSVYSRQFEKNDPGFISYASFIHMEVYMSHPIKLAFCQLVSQKSSKHKEQLKFRNKWFLIYTLIKNPGIKIYRKKFKNKISNKNITFNIKQFDVINEFLV